ncbi:MAG TPA: alpha-glucosidase C-terminal domain-containing protein, partial [Cyclobacteriaceae bacterium]
ALGVDGFRLDAIPYLFERDNTNGENLPETHAFLKMVRKYIDDRYPGTVLLAEANMWPEDSTSYFGKGDECHMNYHFPLMPRMYMALQMENRYPVLDIFDQTPAIPDTCQWAIFLRNHDELTLEMVTDEERDYMYRVYVKDPKARINLGIRHRLAPLMNNNRKKIELLNSLLFSLPGTPVLYYGDEIGMGDNFYLGDRDGVRTPMQWSSGRNAGFSDANPQKLYLPLIQDIDYHYESLNVEIQNRNPSSLLWWMKRIIAKRRQYKSFGRGDIKFINSENTKILVFTRNYEDETMLVVANLSRYAQPVTLELQEYAGRTPVEVISKNKFPSITSEQPYFLSLSPYECQWFLLEKKSVPEGGEKKYVELILNEWSELMQKPILAQLENSILIPYIKQQRWFGSKGRLIELLRIIKVAEIPVPDYNAYILLIEVNYQDGLPELYQLPVTFISESQATELKDLYSQSIIAKIKIDVDGFLHDAIYNPKFTIALLKNLIEKELIDLPDNTVLTFSSSIGKEEVNVESENFKPKIYNGEQSNTAVVFGKSLFLKIFRKLDYVINPDVELSQFLTEESRFQNIPKLLGTIKWLINRESISLAMLQEAVQHSGDGWTYIIDILDEINEKILANPQAIQVAEEIAAGSLTFDLENGLPDELHELFEGTVMEHIRLLGVRTAEMHKALGLRKDLPSFSPEPYSLHYQRSLYAGLQSLVRNTFHLLRANVSKIGEELQDEVKQFLDAEIEILTVFKNIYKQKINVVKIRNHGDFHLGQVL